MAKPHFTYTRDEVTQAYLTLREHNHTIPSEHLAMMREAMERFAADAEPQVHEGPGAAP